MISIIDGSGTGKTRQMLGKAWEEKGIVVCSNPEAMQIKAYNYGITGLDIVGYKEFLECYSPYLSLEPNCKSVFIDELEDFLKAAFLFFNFGKLSGYTLTKNDM